MAKVRAPLFSFGASGKLAKSLVYFGWKGLNVVRSYVVPANPNTIAQQTQRNYLKAAVAKIHTLQAEPTNTFLINDATSYSELGGLEATPRTWFNTISRQWMKQKVAGKIPAVFFAGSCVAGSLKATLTLRASPESSAITNLTINYGVSKTNLINSVAVTSADLQTGKEITSLSSGVKYYFQARCTLPTTFLGTNSGIWHATPTA
jgi:hypothetical protein